MNAVRVHEYRLAVTHCHTRLPFRFGAFTLRETPLCTAFVEVEVDGRTTSRGYSADLLIPKWFEKDPDKSLREDSANLARSAIDAGDRFVELGEARSVFDVWHRVYADQLVGVSPERGLVQGFGVALIERAVIDATCRALGVDFFTALKSGRLGFDAGEVVPELKGFDLATSLADRPRDSVTVRHTVGLLDALTVGEIPPEQRLDDGFPQALEEDIDRYGLTHFKVKIGGGAEVDAPRLIALGEFFAQRLPGGYTVTLDGNEQYDDLDTLATVLDRVEEHPHGRSFLEQLAYIEQPLARAVTFDPERHVGLDRVNSRGALIIDEADHGIDAFPAAWELGYRGVSVKNCKGVFRSLLNRAWCQRLGPDAFQSAEDLTNLPVIALQQDLATVSALGLPHVERNGHHYFCGLDHLSAAESRSACDRHSDLYERRGDRVALNVTDGRLRCGSIHGPGYGVAEEVEISEDDSHRQPLDDWLRADA